jgi:hypothetical protein
MKSLINRLPPLRELDVKVLPSGIHDGQLRHLEMLRISSVEDWNWLLRETTPALKSLHFRVGDGSSFGEQC